MWHRMPDGANAYQAYEWPRSVNMWNGVAERGTACRMALTPSGGVLNVAPHAGWR
ncbi:hypothetical protein [Kosakonia cowanii]|uniref:hypothetical protein n=1 Tax=Kosakonia cowanii TaxID=208223 RepID=UPI0028A6E662|nr:hypothetical protein [Kosakonia cowanii]